jgi:hypothetical protein
MAVTAALGSKCRNYSRSGKQYVFFFVPLGWPRTDGVNKAYDENVLMVENVIFDIHVYQPSESDMLEEFTNGQRGEDDDVTAAGVHELPNRSFEGLWDAFVCALCS